MTDRFQALAALPKEQNLKRRLTIVNLMTKSLSLFSLGNELHHLASQRKDCGGTEHKRAVVCCLPPS